MEFSPYVYLQPMRLQSPMMEIETPESPPILDIGRFIEDLKSAAQVFDFCLLVALLNIASIMPVKILGTSEDLRCSFIFLIFSQILLLPPPFRPLLHPSAPFRPLPQKHEKCYASCK